MAAWQLLRVKSIELLFHQRLHFDNQLAEFFSTGADFRIDRPASTASASDCIWSSRAEMASSAER